ncbi:hypothetical protein [Phenylobacterium aquaticum]|jgi:hypothetical protein|nr:hypothetical protein [Phenylobacterium aquaticum]
MALKAFLSMVALAAVMVGLMLPVPSGQRAAAKSQITTVELGAG